MGNQRRVRQGSSESIQLWTPWWYRPSNFLIWLTLPAVILFSLSDKSQTLSKARLFYSERDLISAIGMLMFLAICCRIFETRSILELFKPVKTRKPNIGTAQARLPEMFFNQTFDWVLMTIFLVSHVVFFRNFFTNPALISGVLSGNLELKHSFKTIPGITTWTQVAMILGAIRGFRWAGVLPGNIRLISWFHLVFFGVLFVRAILWSERLALLEGAIPFLICALPKLGQLTGKIGRFLIQSFPFVAPILILGLFTTFEFFRSWQSSSGMHSSIWTFGWQRLFSYYFEAMNTGSAILEVMGFYRGITLPTTETQYMAVFNGLYMEGILDKEFNNGSGIWYFFARIGNLLTIPALALLAAYLGISYQLFKKGRLFGLIMPINIILLMDFIRIYYWPFATRVLASTICFVIILIWAATVRRRIRVAEAPPEAQPARPRRITPSLESL